jgi:hypothetical protein
MKNENKDKFQKQTERLKQITEYSSELNGIFTKSFDDVFNGSYKEDHIIAKVKAAKDLLAQFDKTKAKAVLSLNKAEKSLKRARLDLEQSANPDSNEVKKAMAKVSKKKRELEILEHIYITAHQAYMAKNIEEITPSTKDLPKDIKLGCLCKHGDYKSGDYRWPRNSKEGDCAFNRSNHKPKS